MFYEPDKKDHGLPYTPFKSCIVPRPIGWISTLSRAGRVNLAPFSQSNIISFNPGFVMFSAGGQHPDGHRKDSVVNAEETGEFPAFLKLEQARWTEMARTAGIKLE